MRVLRGGVSYPHGRPAGIDAAEAAAGFALICQARAEQDLVIETREIRHVTDVEIRELPARVERMRLLAPDVTYPADGARAPGQELQRRFGKIDPRDLRLFELTQALWRARGP